MWFLQVAESVTSQPASHILLHNVNIKVQSTNSLNDITLEKITALFCAGIGVKECCSFGPHEHKHRFRPAPTLFIYLFLF